MSLFSVVVLVTHVPAVYGLALRNDAAHETEHALYLVAALLMWAPLLGVDPLPHRLTPRARLACLATCMVPMLVVGAWLGLASGAVYQHYVTDLGPAALHDQRVAAADHVGRRAAGVRDPDRAQTNEPAEASLVGVAASAGADSDVTRGSAEAVELPDTSAARA